MDTLTLEQAAEFLHWKPRTLRAKCRTDATFPYFKAGKEYRFLRPDLETWLRSYYSNAAKRMLSEAQCIAENRVATGTSASVELDKVLEQRTGKRQGNSSTSSIKKRGIGVTV